MWALRRRARYWCRHAVRPLRTPCSLPRLCTPLHASARLARLHAPRQAGRLLDCLGLGSDASTHLQLQTQAQAQAQQRCRGDAEAAEGEEAAESAEAAESDTPLPSPYGPSPHGPSHGIGSESSMHLFASVCTSAPDEEEEVTLTLTLTPALTLSMSLSLSLI